MLKNAITLDESKQTNGKTCFVSEFSVVSKISELENDFPKLQYIIGKFMAFLDL